MNEREKSYKLTAIHDRHGNRWEEQHPQHKAFSDNLVGCVARYIRQSVDVYTGMPTAIIDLIRGPAGKHIHGIIEIKSLEEIRELENGYLEIVTTKCVYCFEPVVAAKALYPEEGAMIELYLCNDHIQFDSGLYVDGHGRPHVLEAVLNLGHGHHHVAVMRKDRPFATVCTYIPMGDCIKLYSMFCQQQEYANRIVIHNVGTSPLKISFERYPEVWTIQPGEAKRLTRECCDDAAEKAYEEGEITGPQKTGHGGGSHETDM